MSLFKTLCAAALMCAPFFAVADEAPTIGTPEAGIEVGNGIWFGNALMGFSTYYPKTWKSDPRSTSVTFTEPVETETAGAVDISVDHVSEADTSKNLLKYLREEYPADKFIEIEFKEKKAYRSNDQSLTKIFVLKSPREVLRIQFKNQISMETEKSVVFILDLISWR